MAKAKKAAPQIDADLQAWNATSAGVSATRVMAAANGFKDSLTHQALFNEVSKRGQKVIEGDMTEAERMLIGQAESLQGIYSRLVEFAMGADLLTKFDVYMRLALRAQNQSRMTLETLSTIKNPPVVFAKQANVVQNGNQQVNNQTGPAHGETQKRPNELLEQTHGNRLELRAQTEQSEMIRRWKPWEQSTGPKTAEGKLLASRNAWKGGFREMLGELSRAMRMQRQVLHDFSPNGGR